MNHGELKSALLGGSSEVTLSGVTRFTKTRAQRVHQALRRDFALEAAAREWLASRASFAALSSRFQPFDPEFVSGQWPRHYAFRFAEGISDFGKRENVFVYFPYALGLNAEKLDDVFSVELLEISRSIYREIVFPATLATFSNAEGLLESLSGSTLEKTIFLYSVFHEMAHQVGPWRVTPFARPELSVDRFALAVLGELSADLLVMSVLRDFPEILLATVLIRLFWYARAYDPARDNDAWIGKYLWRVCEEGKAIVSVNGRMEFHPERLSEILSRELKLVLDLGQSALDSSEGARRAEAWVTESCAQPVSELASRSAEACRSVPTRLVGFP